MVASANDDVFVRRVRTNGLNDSIVEFTRKESQRIDASFSSRHSRSFAIEASEHATSTRSRTKSKRINGWKNKICLSVVLASVEQTTKLVEMPMHLPRKMGDKIGTLLNFVIVRASLRCRFALPRYRLDYILILIPLRYSLFIPLRVDDAIASVGHAKSRPSCGIEFSRKFREITISCVTHPQ